MTDKKLEDLTWLENKWQDFVHAYILEYVYGRDMEKEVTLELEKGLEIIRGMKNNG